MHIGMTRAQRALRGQAGFSNLGALATVSVAATFGAIVAMSAGDQVGAAEQNVCLYEQRILTTAIEADRVLDHGYATPAGADGLDEVRAAGLLRSESSYWQYTGPDAAGRPQLVLRKPVAGCS